MSEQTTVCRIGLYDLIGDHEMQVSDTAEGDVYQDLISCTKATGHNQFIPANTFSFGHLPEGHRHPELYEFIQAVADLTVRIQVKGTSEHRPEFWPGTAIAYPFYSLRGGTLWRLGSGRISLVTGYTYGYSPEGHRHWMGLDRCRCPRCSRAEAPSSSWWEIEVLTATHVVFDESEAAETSCRLFYDAPDSPVLNLEVSNVGFMNVERDWCRLQCVTCDPWLGEKLYAMKKRCNALWLKVHAMYEARRDVDRFMFIVSHPHGWAKQVSLGQWYSRYLVSDELLNYNKFTYTTSTCAGSSGATVYCLGYTGWWLFQLIHSGTLKCGLNYSGSAFVL